MPNRSRIGDLAVVLLSAGAARGDEALPSGLYEMPERLEMPHLESWAVPQTRVVCVGRPGDALPVPVLTTAAGLDGCTAQGVVWEAERLRYAIACPGRDATRAVADYRMAQDGFRGRIAMVLGAKNMTMTEVQDGRRLGECDVSGRD
jgi:hypothetical protein